jgi:hypothetical protein
MRRMRADEESLEAWAWEDEEWSRHGKMGKSGRGRGKEAIGRRKLKSLTGIWA